MSETSPDQPRRGIGAGRGVVFIAGAKLYFLAAGAAIEFLLPRLVSRFVFGAYGVVTQAVSIANNTMVSGTIQAVSRYTAQEPDRAGSVKATGLKMHLLVGLPLAVLFGALAPLWSRLLHDSQKTVPFLMAAGIIAGYAFYSVLVGSANGTREFHKQAGLDVTFSTLKAGCVLGAAALGLGLEGVIGGWVLAVILVLAVAAFWVGLPRGARAGSIRPMTTFLGGVVVYMILFNAVMLTDQLLLKRLAAEAFLAQGAAAPDAARSADGLVGLYRPAQTLSRLSYQLMIAVTFVVFPLISSAVFQKDRARTREYIHTTLRFSLIFAAALATVLAANPGPLIAVIFPPEYAAAGGPALAFLAAGYVAYVLLAITGTIFNAAGHTRDAILVAGATLALLVGAVFVLVPRFDPGADMLAVTGAATAGAMVAGALLGGVLLVQRFGAFVPWLTAARVAFAAAAGVFAGRLVPPSSPVLTLAESAGVGLVFLVCLILTGELRRADLDKALSAVRRRRT